ncbi:benomyl/methotrexate resistance protein [Hypoxylon trugodes]|uniref:benomyl/methotrexate resistance protein n=1 Tax=Hypoxylon trugodes TaxID=326681 RepID=UPI0021953CBF|nr:benomyl/methotrexate resistance protein [Hypoxylon trugodes]KAI1384538.1 benomyl/methotrexate resistance protein [Hypoxylon trugodes]
MIMATQLRDTEFGLFVRFLSRRKLLQYPDEIDPSSWKKFLPSTGSTPTPPREQINNPQHSKYQEPGANNIVDDGQGVYLVDWYGPDDPENPQNWSSSWKLLIMSIMCILNFSFYIASSIYVPGIPSIMEDLDTSEIVATLGLSLFTLGYGLGPMLWSPMSEIPRLGRGPLYFWTFLTFILLQLPTGFAVNMPMFLIFRVLTGFVGSPPLATGGATIVDMYDPARAAYGICIFSSFGVLGPVFGPIIGGFAAPAKGWRWTIWIFTWLCSLVIILMFFLLPETSAANILYRRAKRLRKLTGDNRFRSQSEIDAANHTIKDHLIVLGRAFTLTFSEPIVFFMDLYSALLYGVLFLWFESFPLVFGEIYGFGTGEQGLAFLGIFIGALVTVPIFLLWIRYGIVPKFAQPSFKPEMVLPPTIVGAVSLPICLFWYGWTARGSVHWILPIIGSGFFTVGVVTLFNTVFNYLGISYPAYVASIFAGNALFRASFGAAFPLFARQLFEQLGIGPGNSLLGGIAVCFIPIPFIFYRYGEKIRHMSKNARHDI